MLPFQQPMRAYKCVDCGLHRSCRANLVQGDGPSPCDILFVGEAPGEQEDIQGKPFVGESGWLIDNDLLPAAGLKRAQVRITNAVRCRPPGNRDPLPEEISACRKHLLAEIAEVQPKVIVCLGKWAVKTVLGLDGVEAYRGRVFTTPEFPNTYVFVTNHPAYTLRNWEAAPQLVADFRKARMLLDGQLHFESLGTYTICDTLETVRQLCTYLKSVPEFSADTETTGFSFVQDKILCFSFSAQPGSGYVIPMYRQYLTPVWSDTDRVEVIQLIKEVMEGSNAKVLQNGVFDLLFFKALGIDVTNFHFDTMLADHLVDENLPHDLDSILARFTTMPLYSDKITTAFAAGKALRTKAKAILRKVATKEYQSKPIEQRTTVLAKMLHDANISSLELAKKIADTGDCYSLIPDDILFGYAAADADATMRVKIPLQQRLQEERLTELFETVTMPMTRITFNLEWTGIRVDIDEVRRLGSEKRAELRQIEQDIYAALSEEYGQPIAPFNLNSRPQCEKVLIDMCGWPRVKTTDGGGTSYDEEAMKTWAHTYHRKAAQIWLKQRGASKQISTYLDGSDESSGILKFVESDGRVHPSFRQHVARTGRLTTADPGIHNIPRDQLLRGIYVPPPGWWWIEADYSQLELRILAAISGDATLNRWFEEGLDVHYMVASNVLNKTVEEVTKEERQWAGKDVNFGLIYGRGAWSMAETISEGRGRECSVAEAQAFIDRYFELLPGVKKWYDSVFHNIYSHGRIRNAFGRVRHLSGATFYSMDRVKQIARTQEQYKMMMARRGDIERQAMNFECQSGGSDLLSKACVRIDDELVKRGMDTTYNLSHHDAMHFCTPDVELVEACKLIKQEMERPCPQFLNRPFPIDLKVCSKWYTEDKDKTKEIKELLGKVA